MFRHFKVAVTKVERTSASQVLVRAQVCVRSLPPDPQGNRTRVSWNPWSARAGKATLQAQLKGQPPKGLFAEDATYAVGDCAVGWIPFATGDGLDEITYANGVGDAAVWDAERLEQPPTTTRGTPPEESSRARSGSIGVGTFVVGDDIRPGRYQARAGSGDVCYWARLRDDSGTSGAIIANGVTEGAASVTIQGSDGAFETSGCTPWVRQ